MPAAIARQDIGTTIDRNAAAILPPTTRLVAYQRVSTVKQGQSGLGLEAQADAIAKYAARCGGVVTATFEERESGKRDDRPALQEAIHLAKVTGARLVIAKLDRLSRDAAFLLTLKKTGVDFVAADMPDANSLTIGIMAIMAEQERKATSLRTKEALAAAKRRGTKLGNPNGAAALRKAARGNSASRAKASSNADSSAANVRPILQAIIVEGVTTLAGIATAFNARGIYTPPQARKLAEWQGRDGRQEEKPAAGTWYASSVSNLLARLDMRLPARA